uniref:Uncharacterized protein n=1 Tax=Gouania willdenowi TaxID=441366 RepID=A0A8C5EYT9_GOUWI
ESKSHRLQTSALESQKYISEPEPSKTVNHNWGFLVAVLLSAVSVSILTAVLAKCQVVRRYLASYRHSRLRETDSVSQCDQSGLYTWFLASILTVFRRHSFLIK